jgi:hypothetical protein
MAALNRNGGAMKRETFRLANVLRVYELRKQQSEMAVSQASQKLGEIDGEIAGLCAEIAAVADLLCQGGGNLSIAGWLACYRKTDQLDRSRIEANVRRAGQLELIVKLQAECKKWAIAEETLLTLRRGVDSRNRDEAAKDQQLQLDEAVLRRRAEVEE